MKYSEKIVVFIDILGFKKMIEDSVARDDLGENKEIRKIIDLFGTVNTVFDIEVVENRKFSSFSDCIVVSFEAVNSSVEMYNTLKDIGLLLCRLIGRGVLCRGAITKGKFIHEEKFLFGPALNEAYLLETKAALYPRVILDRDILDLVLDQKSFRLPSDIKGYISNNLLKLDSDGMYYVDYFNDIVENEQDRYSIRYLAYLHCLGKVIRSGLMASVHHSKADLRVKYAWMRERYNQSIRNLNAALKENLVINMDEDYGLALAGLKEISPYRGKSDNVID